MPILTVLLYVMIFVVALLLIALILIQPSKSGGMGAAFGGIGESVFGGKAGSHLTKSTVIMTALFFVIALLLAAVIGRTDRGAEGTSMRAKLAEVAAEAEAAKPAADAVKPAAEEAAKKAEAAKPALPAAKK